MVLVNKYSSVTLNHNSKQNFVVFISKKCLSGYGAARYDSWDSEESSDEGNSYGLSYSSEGKLSK